MNLKVTSKRNVRWECTRKTFQYIFFAKQYILLSYHSELPQNLPQLTTKCLASIKFSSSGYFSHIKIICQLDPNKAHGDDILSI